MLPVLIKKEMNDPFDKNKVVSNAQEMIIFLMNLLCIKT